jgi:hypothetical protein
MEAMAVEELSAGEPCAERLAEALLPIAADPGQTRHLHEILGAYCHQCRNLLHSLKLCLFLARRGSGAQGDDDAIWRSLEATNRELERFLDRLHQLCRPTPLSTIRVGLEVLVADRREEWSRVLAERGRLLVLGRRGGDAEGAFDPIRLGQALDDLVAWRARDGTPGTALRLRYGTDEGSFGLEWDEPGGRPQERRDQPWPGPASLEQICDDGAGDVATAAYRALTIPVLARVMALHGGLLETTDSGRWRLRLRWRLDANPG